MIVVIILLLLLIKSIYKTNKSIVNLLVDVNAFSKEVKEVANHNSDALEISLKSIQDKLTVLEDRQIGMKQDGGTIHDTLLKVSNNIANDLADIIGYVSPALSNTKQQRATVFTKPDKVADVGIAKFDKNKAYNDGAKAFKDMADKAKEIEKRMGITESIDDTHCNAYTDLEREKKPNKARKQRYPRNKRKGRPNNDNSL